MSPRAILFDFDGTLIDSATSVLASLDHALKRSNVTPVVTLDRALIGPPLRETLATLTGSDDAALLDILAQAFRDDYDTRGYTRTEVYAGVPEMLQGLQTQGIALHIVTNKRIAATRRILEHLGWTAWFAGIYALDALEPAAPNKPHLVAEVQTKAFPCAMRLPNCARPRAWARPKCCAANTCLQRPLGWSAIRPKTDARPRRTRYVFLPRLGVMAQRPTMPKTTVRSPRR